MTHLYIYCVNCECHNHLNKLQSDLVRCMVKLVRCIAYFLRRKWLCVTDFYLYCHCTTTTSCSLLTPFLLTVLLLLLYYIYMYMIRQSTYVSLWWMNYQVLKRKKKGIVRSNDDPNFFGKVLLASHTLSLS